MRDSEVRLLIYHSYISAYRVVAYLEDVRRKSWYPRGCQEGGWYDAHPSPCTARRPRNWTDGRRFVSFPRISNLFILTSPVFYQIGTSFLRTTKGNRIRHRSSSCRWHTRGSRRKPKPRLRVDRVCCLGLLRRKLPRRATRKKMRRVRRRKVIWRARRMKTSSLAHRASSLNFSSCVGCHDTCRLPRTYLYSQCI